VWQYWVHFIHVAVRVNLRWYNYHLSLDQLERIFRVLLRNGVDLEVCCFQHSPVRGRIFNSQGINDPEAINILRTRHQSMLSHGKESNDSTTDSELPSGTNSQVEEGQWKEHHSLTAVVQDIFNTKEKSDGANELLELVARLQTDKEYANQARSKVSQKKARRREKAMRNEGRKVRRC
jgi:hypothetical protein